MKHTLTRLLPLHENIIDILLIKHFFLVLANIMIVFNFNQQTHNRKTCTSLFVQNFEDYFI
jgi:hypothetical protein